MTLVKNLITALQARNPNAQVFHMTTRKEPKENLMLGVIGREEMFDQQYRHGEGVAPDDVFLVVGRRLRPGSLSAWTLIERANATDPADPAGERAGDDGNDQSATLAAIAERHLWIETLEERGIRDLDFHEVGVKNLRSALDAAYLAGMKARPQNPSTTPAAIGTEIAEGGGTTAPQADEMTPTEVASEALDATGAFVRHPASEPGVDDDDDESTDDYDLGGEEPAAQPTA